MKRVAVVGSGPGGLMAATEAARTRDGRLGTSDVKITLFEKRPSFGRKLLVAGSSGLNITHDAAAEEFAGHYEGDLPWARILNEFSPAEWIAFINTELKLETFLGTSGRYFVREMKAAGLLKQWTGLLREKGVTFKTQHELTRIESGTSGVRLHFANEVEEFDQVVLALGGGSWEDETPRWPSILEQLGVRTIPFTSENTGYEVEWAPKFLEEAARKPLKNVVLKTAKGEKQGELMITEYGLEGTPVYFVGALGRATLDLKPNLEEAEVLDKLMKVKENLAPLRRAKKVLNLSEEALALLFHHMPASARTSLKDFAHAVKSFPIELIRPRPLSESISSRGGVALDEVDENFMLKKIPRVYCVGEMLDWHAPTGGFLIQGCVSMGAKVGKGLVS